MYSKFQNELTILELLLIFKLVEKFVLLTTYCWFLRKTLYNVGEEIGQDELKKLKALLTVELRVGKRTMDTVKDVWDCLDIMEERLLDSELFPFLKTVYTTDERLLEIIDDFAKGMFFGVILIL